MDGDKKMKSKHWQWLFFAACGVGFLYILFGGPQPQLPEPLKTERIKSYCDEEKGLEYIVFDGHKAGGVTARMNDDGTQSTCPKAILDIVEAPPQHPPLELEE
jgi:hypothetical protein